MIMARKGQQARCQREVSPELPIEAGGNPPFTEPLDFALVATWRSSCKPGRKREAVMAPGALVRFVVLPGWRCRMIRYVAVVVLLCGGSVFTPVEFGPGHAPIQPELFFLLGLSCAGLALGMWARERRGVWVRG
jgi:hypothetical protein